MSGKLRVVNNSAARWVAIILVLLSMIVGTVMYVADVRADVDQNTRDIAVLRVGIKEILFRIRRIEQNQIRIMFRLKIEPVEVSPE